jgi:tricorn protease
MKTLTTAVVLTLLAASVATADSPKKLLLQKPTASQTQIAFAYAGDLWIVGRDGGEARRLTTGIGIETDPIFSPDGQTVAFTGEYDGNLDVYVMPAAGGEPRRLTYHPGPDIALGWTPDGKQILFRSQRDSYARFNRLYTIPVSGGFPSEIPLPMGDEGSFSPDGSRIAYVPYSNTLFISSMNFHIAWKRYRGGTTSPIWIANLTDSHIEKIPRNNSNDYNPLWIGNKVYFLSDRDGSTSLYVYDLASKEVNRLIDNQGLDICSASAGLDCIVYDQFGVIHRYDLNTGKPQPIDIRVAGDFAPARPHFVKTTQQIQHAGLSPSGVRAVFEARGEIFTVPAEKGDIRNLTNTPGAAERDPAWSPDGKQIAYFSDESGEYQLHVRPPNGAGEVKKYALGESPSFYYGPRWSPTGKKIAYTDKRVNLWVLDLATGKSTKIDTNTYDFRTLDPAWSPDGKWLTYSKLLKNYLHAIFVYDTESGKKHQITDGMSDARFPEFDRGSKYLYFTASTDIGPTIGGGEMSAMNRPVSRSAYLVVLPQDQLSPLAPESDEEKAEDSAKKEQDKPATKDRASEDKKNKAEKPAPVRIDAAGIDQRILALPVPAHNYVELLAGKAGTMFLVEAPVLRSFDGPPQFTLHKFDLQKRKAEKVLDGVREIHLSHSGEKVLYRQGEGWFIAGTAQAPKPGEGALKLDSMEARVDPAAEWKQMYREVWRIERDFLYDPGAHGLDLKAAEKKYAAYLDGISSRRDLNYLFTEMLGELSLGHVFIGGGETPEVKRVKSGLLGADYKIENGRYRFARILNGENWNPQLRAPLTQPGTRVKEGEYLLAVNGQEVRPPDNVYRFFEGSAGKSVILKVGPDPDGKGAREVPVVPVEDEQALRYRDWIDRNRRKVYEMTNGRVAYVHLPDTAVGGLTSFNRYFFAQVDRQAAVIDERFNGGGQLAEYIIHYLNRPLMNYISAREGADRMFPSTTIYGPKAMIINEKAGSGGDAMPYYFRQQKVGPLIGTRTWGGLVGIGGYPTLMDGGSVTAPHMAIWFPSGQWEVENHGVAPDIEVEFDPQAWRAGHDPQLEKAVAVVLEELEKNPRSTPKRPDYPNYHKK